MSDWPEMRHDRRNTGATTHRAHYAGDQPWSFRTGRGIFTTPVLGPDGAVYFGSADGVFYALERDGALRWSFRSAGIIDSAALVSAESVTVGSGDGYLYCFRTAGPGTGSSRLRWRFAAQAPDGSGQQVSWWEGNVEAGPDGLLLAGNTAGHAYALHDDGTPAWIFPTANAVWTAAAVGEDGVSYWGSLDFCVHALDRQGQSRWSVPTLGFVVSSPALGLDGTLYVGSFDGHLYALDAATGAQHWSFATGDAIYSSPALLEVDGRTRAIFVGSTDGSLYAFGPDGAPLWRFDTGDVVRSSPVVSRAPTGEDGWIVYVGSSNGVLYALDGERGTCRWSYDLAMSEPALADRNSLNGCLLYTSLGRVAQPPQVDDPADARPSGRRGEDLRNLAVALGEGLAARHRMHQVVRDVNAIQRSTRCVLVGEVALDQLHAGPPTTVEPAGVAGYATNARTLVAHPLHQPATDVPGRAGDQDPRPRGPPVGVAHSRRLQDPS